MILSGEISEEWAVPREEIFVAAVRCNICSRCCVPGQSHSPKGFPEGGGDTAAAGAPGDPGGEAKSPKILTTNSEGGIYALFAPAELAYFKLPGMRSYERAEEIKEAKQLRKQEEQENQPQQESSPSRRSRRTSPKEQPQLMLTVQTMSAQTRIPGALVSQFKARANRASTRWPCHSGKTLAYVVSAFASGILWSFRIGAKEMILQRDDLISLTALPALRACLHLRQIRLFLYATDTRVSICDGSTSVYQCDSYADFICDRYACF